MTWLLYLFGAYLAVCYLWAMYLVVRLHTGKRLRVLLRLQRDTKAQPAPVTEHAAPAAATVPTYTAAEPAAPQRRKAAA